jgi:hypothetical protein
MTIRDDNPRPKASALMPPTGFFDCRLYASFLQRLGTVDHNDGNLPTKVALDFPQQASEIDSAEPFNIGQRGDINDHHCHHLEELIFLFAGKDENARAHEGLYLLRHLRVFNKFLKFASSVTLLLRRFDTHHAVSRRLDRKVRTAEEESYGRNWVRRSSQNPHAPKARKWKLVTPT